MYKSIEAKETPFQKGIDSRVSQEKRRFEKKKTEWFYYLANALIVTLKLFSINIMVCKFHPNKKINSLN